MLQARRFFGCHNRPRTTHLGEREAENGYTLVVVITGASDPTILNIFSLPFSFFHFHSHYAALLMASTLKQTISQRKRSSFVSSYSNRTVSSLTSSPSTDPSQAELDKASSPTKTPVKSQKPGAKASLLRSTHIKSPTTGTNPHKVNIRRYVSYIYKNFSIFFLCMVYIYFYPMGPTARRPIQPLDGLCLMRIRAHLNFVLLLLLL